MKTLLALTLLVGLTRAESLPRDGFDLHYQTIGNDRRSSS